MYEHIINIKNYHKSLTSDSALTSPTFSISDGLLASVDSMIFQEQIELFGESQNPVIKRLAQSS